jgi:hypothetical protein
MRQEMVDKVHALVGDDGADDTFVIAELARAREDLLGSPRLRPRASILAREAYHAEPDDDAVVRLAARRVVALSGPRMPDAAGADFTRVPLATRTYARFSFGSRCDLARENGAENGRHAP